MERVHEFAIGLDACKVSLTGWARKKPMTLSWRWNVSDTISEEKWLGTSRHCRWKVDHVTFWRQFFVAKEQKRVRVSGTLLVNLTGLANDSTQLASWATQRRRLGRNIWRRKNRFSTYLEEKPNWGPEWSHDNLILGFSLTDSPEWIKLSKDLK